MTLWRISRHRYLRGAGGLKVPGRWHHAGQPVVCLPQSPATALLEVCVHTAANDVPPEFTLLKIEGPDPKVSVITLDDLPENWRSRLEVTRDLGTAWLQKKQSALLQIPSAIVPETGNFLFNPLHPDAKKSALPEPVLAHGVSPHAWGLRLRRVEGRLTLASALVLPSARSDGVGTRNRRISELNILPADAPLPRFKCGLATALAGSGARVARYTSPVRLFHQLHVGLSRRYPELWLPCASRRGGDPAPPHS